MDSDLRPYLLCTSFEQKEGMGIESAGGLCYN
jgi:hypothetical protein